MIAQDVDKYKLIISLRSKGIKDTRTLSAIEQIPREIFVSELLSDQAYQDIALPIGYGQTISQPYVVAKMTQSLEIDDRDIILEVGTGCGYQASILAKMCRRLYSIERHRPLYEMSQNNFKQLRIENITALCGDGSKGWPTNMAFDKIMVTAACFEKTPHALLGQLKLGGHMIIPIGDEQSQVLRKYTKISDDTFSSIDMDRVQFVPLLEGIARPVEIKETEENDAIFSHATRKAV